VHKILQQADYDFKRIQYNTVVSACMKMLNTLESAKLADVASNAVIAEGLSIFLRMLNPVAPHITHALWQELGYAGVYGDILERAVAAGRPGALEQSEIEMMIQVNGKLRGSVKVPKEAPTRPPSKRPRWPRKRCRSSSKARRRRSSSSPAN
jgi:leucyl-tRNA synthetase